MCVTPPGIGRTGQTVADQMAAGVEDTVAQMVRQGRWPLVLRRPLPQKGLRGRGLLRRQRRGWAKAGLVGALGNRPQLERGSPGPRPGPGPLPPSGKGCLEVERRPHRRT